MGDVQAFPDTTVEAGVLLITARGHSVEGCRRLRIEGRKERHVYTALRQPVGQQAGHLLPRAVMPRRRTPGDRPQKCNFSHCSRIQWIRRRRRRSQRKSASTRSFSVRRCAIPDARSDLHLWSRNAALQAGTLQREQRLQVGQCGLGAFVGVQTGSAETVVAAATGEVVYR